MKLYSLEIEQYNCEYSITSYEFFLNKSEAINRKSEIENYNDKRTIVYMDRIDFEDARDIMTVDQFEKICQINLSPLLEKAIEDDKFRFTEGEIKEMFEWYENSFKELPIKCVKF